jgi:hypothetical protein
MKLHADHRTVFELQHGMLGRQVAYFERAEDAQGYVRLVNEAGGEAAPQNLQIDVRAAVQEERCAIAYRLGEMSREAKSAVESAAYMRVAQMLDARSAPDREGK